MQLTTSPVTGVRVAAARRAPMRVAAMYTPPGDNKRGGSKTKRPTRAVGSPGVNWNEIQSNPEVEKAVEIVKAALVDAQAKWETVQDKKTTLALVGGSVAGTFLFSWVLSWLDYVPIIPDLLTFVGFIVSADFVWKYVLFKTGRDSLKTEAMALYAALRSNLDGADEPKV